MILAGFLIFLACAVGFVITLGCIVMLKLYQFRPFPDWYYKEMEEQNKIFASLVRRIDES